MAGQPSDTKLELYEVVSYTLIEKCDMRQTFGYSTMKDGDIICAQPLLSKTEKEELRSLPLDPESYYVSAGMMDSQRE
ncbi:hypothetical protein BJV82DRAFT_268888 [Fennellomyces sp. T-0311]|nr:hypothetical protein BJV82DRAFT_268888 [Fennellomyces sp. T-0311]